MEIGLKFVLKNQLNYLRNGNALISVAKLFGFNSGRH